MSLFTFAENLVDKLIRLTETPPENFRIVECEDSYFRPQIYSEGIWKFITWCGCDLQADTIQEAKYNAQRYISSRAFPELKQYSPDRIVNRVVSDSTEITPLSGPTLRKLTKEEAIELEAKWAKRGFIVDNSLKAPEDTIRKTP
jgi:hypothetical protein